MVQTTFTVDILTYCSGVLFLTCCVICFVLWKRYTRSSKSISGHPKNVVILHQTGRAPFAPSLSPFAVKLETYLRIAKIPYENIHDKIRGPKGKWPWIEYNNLVLPDSQLVMEFLNGVQKVNLNEHLADDQRSVAVSFQRMLDEHTYWLMVIYRWNYDKEMKVLKLANWSWLKIQVARWLTNKQTYQQGLGRHNRKELLLMLNKDFSSLSKYLGNKKYMFGDTPCELDCSLFGQLSQFKWHLPLSEIADLFKRYPNLDRYCKQIKDSYWADWNECVLCPETGHECEKDAKKT